jgi:hypothetical protein
MPTPISDPWLWVPLAIGLALAAFCFRMELRQRRNRRISQLPVVRRGRP